MSVINLTPFTGVPNHIVSDPLILEENNTELDMRFRAERYKINNFIELQMC